MSRDSGDIHAPDEDLLAFRFAMRQITELLRALDRMGEPVQKEKILYHEWLQDFRAHESYLKQGRAIVKEEAK